MIYQSISTYISTPGTYSVPETSKKEKVPLHCCSYVIPLQSEEPQRLGKLVH